ncbi:MAG: zf-HC2 domain-containing protein [Candidatus Zixiibacteriota bacterium]
MRCRKARKRLSAFVDGELGEREKEGISRHIETCPSCGEKAKALSSLSVLLREEKESIEASPYFWNRLEQAIIRAETNKKAFDSIWEWLNRTLIPAGGTVVIAIGLFMGTHLGGAIYANIAQILNPDDSSPVQEEINQSLHLNTLSDFPQESIGEIYTGLLAENNFPK